MKKGIATGVAYCRFYIKASSRSCFSGTLSPSQKHWETLCILNLNIAFSFWPVAMTIAENLSGKIKVYSWKNFFQVLRFYSRTFTVQYLKDAEQQERTSKSVFKSDNTFLISIQRMHEQYRNIYTFFFYKFECIFIRFTSHLLKDAIHLFGTILSCYYHMRTDTVKKNKQNIPLEWKVFCSYFIRTVYGISLVCIRHSNKQIFIRYEFQFE